MLGRACTSGGGGQEDGGGMKYTGRVRVAVKCAGRVTVAATHRVRGVGARRTGRGGARAFHKLGYGQFDEFDIHLNPNSMSGCV